MELCGRGKFAKSDVKAIMIVAVTEVVDVVSLD